MEHPDSNEPTDENVAGASADNSESPAATTPSAIERQIAAASRLGYGNQTPHQEAADRVIGRRKTNYYARHRRRRRFGLVSSLVLFLLIAAAVALVFTDLGRSLQDAVSALLPAAQTAATHTASPANAPQTVVSKRVPEVATSNAISIPIADVSLRSRPGLLEQLVQVYRSQLTANPNDSVTLAALGRLQERSLSELETMLATEDEPAFVSSLEVVTRLFPELTDNPRYKYLIARMDHIHRRAKTEPPAEPEHSTPLTTAISPVESVSPPSDSSAEVAKKHAENALPPKPAIRVISITPGAMVEQRFVPNDEGNVFMVAISYRNFESAEDQSEVTLVARMGIPGDSTVLAETPVELSGDRGAKSFLMETLMPGNTGEKYLLNFMLDGKILASRTMRLSVPKE